MLILILHSQDTTRITHIQFTQCC